MLSHIGRNLLRQRHAVIDDLSVLLLAQRFQAHPQFQGIETAGGLQRLGDQVRHALRFIKLRVQVGRLITHQLIVACFLQQEGAAG